MSNKYEFPYTVSIKGKTAATLSINALDITIKGTTLGDAVSHSTIFDHVEISSKEQQSELEELEKADLIEVTYPGGSIESDNSDEVHKEQSITDGEQQENSDDQRDKAVIATRDGARDINTLTSEDVSIEESERTAKSLEAMKQLEKEEQEELEGVENSEPPQVNDTNTEEENSDDAVVVTANRQADKRSLKRSVADSGNNEVEWIPPDGEDKDSQEDKGENKDEKSDDINEFFVDPNPYADALDDNNNDSDNSGNSDDADDNFIEV